MKSGIYDPVIAVGASDLHFSEKRPRFRRDPDWIATQVGYWNQLLALGQKHNAPVLLGGDVFDGPDCDARLVNELIIAARLHEVPIYSIAGQHDLRHHRYDSWQGTAYGTLVAAGVTEHLRPDRVFHVSPKLGLIGQSWDTVANLDPPVNHGQRLIFLIHQYVWGNAVKSAVKAEIQTEANHVSRFAAVPDFVLFGDNHAGFLVGRKREQFNPGTFIRRKSDEYEYNPTVGILREKFGWEPITLNTSEDVFAEDSLKASLDKLRATAAETEKHLDYFLAELKSTDHGKPDVLAFINRRLGITSSDNLVKRMITEALNAE